MRNFSLCGSVVGEYLFMQMKINDIFFISIACLLSACGGSSSNRQELASLHVDGDVVTVADASPIAERLEVARAESSLYRKHFVANAMVRAIPSRYAEVVSPFAGRVVRSYVQLGQSVQAGAPLYEIISATYADACRAYKDAAHELEQARKALNRAKDLQANRVGSLKDVEEAQLTFTLKQQAEEEAKSALQVFHVNASEVTLSGTLIVRAPIAGKVVVNNLTIGQYVKEDSEALVTLADLSKVWVVASVKERDIPLLDKLQQVDITLTSASDCRISGRICYVGEILDEQTRSVEVFIECDNVAGRMKPNMYASVHLIDCDTEVIALPTTAVLQQEQSCFVFKVVGKGQYRRVPVDAVATDDNRFLIERGIEAGDSVVVRGGFYLLDAK
jgi:cobalt-zinc-cadmium efflux system membrane fusion protein